ncbi:hypothetical protein [Streptomyces europaeiscabiei]|uniref:hypothetical protein n=1 Tax=Streptomyces europaeiscabiei TaxID=146819 RepID=UPI0029B14E5E|nr:hypothetical protein [Streptomyces europaeiscabiei]MDX3611990.1 hypothetical protein [Streptomyces europaeiscabiei]
MPSSPSRHRASGIGHRASGIGHREPQGRRYRLLLASRIAKKPTIKTSLSKSPTLWFLFLLLLLFLLLFLFNGGVVAYCHLAMDGVKGIATAGGMGLA